MQWALIHEAQERIQRSAATRPGARELITYFVGQVVGSLNEVKSARQVVLDMVEEYIDVDDVRVVTLHRVIATGRASGIETVRELGGLIEIRDGLVVSQWIYLDRSDALKAAGLEA